MLKRTIWPRVNYVTIFGELYQIKLLGISNDFIQFIHLRSASGVNSDVIRMAVTAQLIRIFIECYVCKPDKVFYSLVLVRSRLLIETTFTQYCTCPSVFIFGTVIGY